MGAVETAQRVLDWVARPAGSLPNGTLWQASALAAPPSAALDRLREITRRSVALHGAGDPPFGDRSPVGVGAVLLAAAIGGRDQRDQAVLIATSLGGRTGPADALARHAVVAPALAPLGEGQGDGRLTERLLRASPLTALLHHPSGDPDSAEGRDAERTAELLLERPRGREVLVAGLASCSPDAAVLAWRAYLLNQWLRHGRLDLVRDVYTMARLRHARRWDEQIGRALRWYGAPSAQMRATADYWAPAGRVDLRRTRPVARGHEPALGLVRRYRDWTGGAR
ncbi:hypothetical protein Sme01_35780 [Sphaerisporangium melleum]|uniref:FtsH ternary system domain-containing protein n=1 Tax=Sphaerisporangium melleum TaxID=321316 RepID=A0A917RAE4_9ACTN|nr:hypothetical protein [Sphaerisporangium melleum]GGK97282.1 hypothetical protein GCM10007964_44430 [Sphaerisporangium melleum]GII71102.1 hypothetical protein Sme01_35780 [Sphaerisporangium melleum]